MKFFFLDSIVIIIILRTRVVTIAATIGIHIIMTLCVDWIASYNNYSMLCILSY